ncbi:MAG: aminopeptidase P N-terminal domain-containing protein [Gemmatimonadetes bacterium]|nr:aminopeptidase P N-terminal domain-containing protein [Gemmatimonadota bacterium]
MSRDERPPAPAGGFFPPEALARRRERVIGRLEEDGGVLVLPAAPTRVRSRDVEYRYRPDSELFYLTGFIEPEAVAVLRPGDEARFVLFVRPRDEKAEVWTGPRIGPEAAAAAFGADAAHPMAELEEKLPALLGGASRIYFRLGRGDRVEGLVLEALARARLRGQRTGTGPRGVLDPGLLLDDLRLVKDEHEIRAIRQAAGITLAAFPTALGRARPGAGEWEVEAAFDAALRQAGAFGPAFPTIVASGPNAGVLHYVANARRIEAGDLVLIDGGAEVAFYAADVSRTVPVDKRFTPEQRAVCDLVLEAYRQAIARAVPGEAMDSVQRAGLETLVRGLVELGALGGSVDEIIEQKTHERYVPHRISHWLGLDVHDVGDYAVGGEPRRLAPGMVLTVEPGLYFPPDAREGTARYAGIGVRIEDDVLITEDQCEVLTGALPVEPDEVTALVGD